MNEKSCSRLQPTDLRPQLTRITRMLHRAQDSLHGFLGRSPSYLEIEEWTGVAEGTLKDWFNNKGRPTAEFLVQLLERVPERPRNELLAAACRVCPTLDHPRIKCDEVVRSWLRTIIFQAHGLSFIEGGSDESRTFLLTAMGHSFLGLTQRPHRVSGVDVHEPDWFVPVPGVKYLKNLFNPLLLREAVQTHWPAIQPARTQLVVFNGALGGIANVESRVRGLTAHSSVVFAEAGTMKSSVLKQMTRGPVQVIRICSPPREGESIALEIRAI